MYRALRCQRRALREIPGSNYGRGFSCVCVMAGRGSVSSQLVPGGECGGPEGASVPTRRRCQMEAVGWGRCHFFNRDLGGIQ